MGVVDPPGRGTVLVVDDDAAIRFLCRVNLELDGWTVREAATAAEALDVARSDGVSVVIVDRHLGPQTSEAFVRELRREQPSVPVALLTGSADVDASLARDYEAVIPKPFTLDELIRTVRSLVAPIESSR